MCIKVWVFFFVYFREEAMSAALGIVTWMCFLFILHIQLLFLGNFLYVNKISLKTKVDTWLK